MHHLKQHLVETDTSQDGPVGSSESTFDQFLQSDASDVDSTVQGIDDQRKNTLFNIRITSLGKRLSDRLGSEIEEPTYTASDSHKPPITGGKKSRKTVLVTYEDTPETFQFVPHKATKFAESASSTEIVLEEVLYWNHEDRSEATDASECGPEHQEAGVMSTDGHFCPENKLNGNKQNIPLQNTTDTSSALDKPSDLFSLIHSSTPRTNLCELTRVDVGEASVKESEFVSSSKNSDSGFISITESDDDVGVGIKNSSLLDDSSSLATPTKSAMITSENEESWKLNPRVEEHSLQLGSAFTEFVNIQGFEASAQNKHLHSENSSDAKYERQLDVLWKTGSSKALKSYLRNSQWPAESSARCQLWEQLCNHLLQAEEHLYQKLVDDMLSEDAEESWMLPTLVEPTCIHSYFLTACGTEHARTVVNLISHLHPDITYCPVLHPMTSLFLHYMTPEACFNCMQALLRSRQSCYFTQTKIKTEACKYVLRDLAKKYAKQAYDLMLRSGPCVEAVFDNWMCWIFRDLPFQYLVRIIDSFLLEGYKIFYRISLAIVILFARSYKRQGKQSSEAADVGADISRFCTNMSVDPRKLIQVAFGIRGLSRREISRLQERNEAYLTSLPASTVNTRCINVLRLRERVPSAILTTEMLQNIWQWIPEKLSLMKPTLIFSSNEHGTAIRTLYAQIEHSSHTILAVKTTSNEIFGAVCSSPWYTRHEKNKPKTSFFGTGETFVFSVSPVFEKYLWCPEYMSELFMAGDDQMLMIGSGNGTAIYLDGMLNRGSSTHCDTFHNAPLCSTIDFSCQVVEVFGFTE